MSVLIDPARDFINISFMLTETRAKNGNVTYTFIRSPDQLKALRDKGYTTIAEIEQRRQEQSFSDTSRMRQPGTAVQPVQQGFDPEKVVQSIETQWVRLAWKELNTILSKCIIRKDFFDNVMFQDLKLKACLKRWNLKDERGNPIPCTPEAIDQLAPEVATEMLRVFDKLTEPREEKETK